MKIIVEFHFLGSSDLEKAKAAWKEAKLTTKLIDLVEMATKTAVCRIETRAEE